MRVKSSIQPHQVRNLCVLCFHRRLLALQNLQPRFPLEPQRPQQRFLSRSSAAASASTATAEAPLPPSQEEITQRASDEDVMSQQPSSIRSTPVARSPLRRLPTITYHYSDKKDAPNPRSNHESPTRKPSPNNYNSTNRRDGQALPVSHIPSTVKTVQSDFGGREWSQLPRSARRDWPATTGTFERSLPSTQPTSGTRTHAPARRQPVCFRCGEVGHVKKDCLVPQSELREQQRRPDQPRNQNSSSRGRHNQDDDLFSRRPVSTAEKSAAQKHNWTSDVPSTGDAVSQDNRSDAWKKKKAASRFEDEDMENMGSNSRRQRRERHASFSRGEEDDNLDVEFSRKRKTRGEKKKQREQQLIPIILPPFISVNNLAQALKVRGDVFINKMEELGFEDVEMDHVLTAENAGLIALEYGYEPVSEAHEEEYDLVERPEAADRSSLPSRPPVITIMGHVDHGKTTLLDHLRKSAVAAGEHGGITQHIGAFSVPMSSGKTITFLDTPGHAAFLTMRQRGANVTDIVILVVAADDSVKPQTIEAIKHAKNANVPIIVAINKIDKPEADGMRVRQDLARHGIEVEDYGGDVQAVEVSGKTGQGMKELEEAAALLAEVQDMRAEVDGPAEGWIIEATKSKSGTNATVLVKRGTLRPGNVIVAGTAWARVRGLSDALGQPVLEAPPGTPVVVDGWREQPSAGDQVLQAPSEQKASAVIALRQARADRTKQAQDLEVINEQRRHEAERRRREKDEAAATNSSSNAGDGQTTASRDSALSEPSVETLHFILKADVSGSLEAVHAAIDSIPLGNQPVRISVLAGGIGGVTESDISHAAAAPKGTASIIAFNVPGASNDIAQAAQAAGVGIVEQNIIYRLVDSVRALLEARLPPLITRRVTGEAEIAQVFDIGIGGRKKMLVAGCKVRNGMVVRGGKVRVFRGVVPGDESGLVYEGTISSLKNVKKDVQEMRKDTECGMAFEGWEDFRAGDAVQVFEEKHEKRKLAG